MRHADKIVLWKRPKNWEDWQNSLHDAAHSLPPGKMLVYYEGLYGCAPDKLCATAAKVAGVIGLALVQFPNGGVDTPMRRWCYAIQKRTARA
ncbi:hypothetical protein SAMN05421774_10880 [Gemmobacter megaterium]|uniref:Uncharacterized protein n=1 Tax=Gemmobacter megaterium TaxID=1086013 RepID=A0A1N7QB68_9RHOB|nr:hypothetical protein [Gemmobacter megaterium]GGE24125.1 hypothetical protein GCM10011345_32640 [Gemmobacter megaterium]SIT20138.1 hypothetical protein SAMN05421774_10880 [Gemmobacter megaterium]